MAMNYHLLVQSRGALRAKTEDHCYDPSTIRLPAKRCHVRHNRRCNTNAFGLLLSLSRTHLSQNAANLCMRNFCSISLELPVA